MGVSINYAKKKKTEAALRRALWDYMEARTDQRLESDAADEMISKVLGCVKWISEDINALGEFRHAGIPRKHWYEIVMHIGESKVEAQNILDGAENSPPHPPTRAPLWIGMIIRALALFQRCQPL